MTRRLQAILEDCETRDVRLSAKPSSLSVRGSLTPELREELRCHKPNILYYLRTGRCHHELEPNACEVCSGRVQQMIEEAS